MYVVRRGDRQSIYSSQYACHPSLLFFFRSEEISSSPISDAVPLKNITINCDCSKQLLKLIPKLKLHYTADSQASQRNEQPDRQTIDNNPPDRSPARLVPIHPDRARPLPPLQVLDLPEQPAHPRPHLPQLHRLRRRGGAVPLGAHLPSVRPNLRRELRRELCVRRGPRRLRLHSAGPGGAVRRRGGGDTLDIACAPRGWGAGRRLLR